MRSCASGSGAATLIALTLLESPASSESSLELVNEAGPAEALVCLVLGADEMQELAIGSLRAGESKSARIEPPAEGPFECVCVGVLGRTRPNTRREP